MDSLPVNAEIAEGIAPVKDRLTTTLFLAALFHGIIILGVTFALPRLDDAPTPTLEVLLLTTSDLKAADNASAQYLAQRNQKGSGTTDERVRPANPASSPVSVQQAGVAEGNSSESREAVAGAPSTELLSSRSDRSDVSYRSGAQQPQEAQAPLALAPTPPSPIATNTVEETLRLRGLKPDGQIEVIPNTRASILAPYLDAWRQKVERLGTLNFPQVAHQPPGNPVLEVMLKADGSLGRAVVRRSSGRKEIDQAALSILRLASPFDPFPADLRKAYAELRFAYEWQFVTQTDRETGRPDAAQPDSGQN